MKIICKQGCLCSDINKNFCCVECSNFNACEEPCMYLIDGETNKEVILNVCKHSKISNT